MMIQKAEMRDDGKLLEKTEVTNGLRQGYTMTSTLLTFMLVLLKKHVPTV